MIEDANAGQRAGRYMERSFGHTGVVVNSVRRVPGGRGRPDDVRVDGYSNDPDGDPFAWTVYVTASGRTIRVH